MMLGVVADGQIGGGSPECIKIPAIPSVCEQPYTPTHADPALKPANQMALVSTPGRGAHQCQHRIGELDVAELGLPDVP